VSVISSAMPNKIIANFLSATFYSKEILIISVLLFLLVIFTVPLKFPYLILLFAIFVLFLISLFYFIGKKRRSEIAKVNKVIANITGDNYSSADEIKLGNNLTALEEDIKKMFLRTQNDIANLKKLEKVRTEFLGNVSHELRTPIFAVQGFIETLLNGAIEDPKVNRMFLQKAYHHTENLNNLLNDLINISMIESGEMRMSFRYFNLYSYLEELIADIKQEADEKNIELILHPFKTKLKVFGDKDRLKQALNNLVLNSIKYTEKGKVEIFVEEKDDQAKIVVRDTGIGIPEDDLERIFERFYRVDKGRSREVGGTGLGLAIVKHILDAHGSKVYVKSKLGEGSVFSFYLKK